MTHFCARRPDVLRLRLGTERKRFESRHRTDGPEREAAAGEHRRLSRCDIADAPAVVRAQHEKRRVLQPRVQSHPAGRHENVSQSGRPVRVTTQPVEHERVIQSAQGQTDQLSRDRMRTVSMYNDTVVLT